MEKLITLRACDLVTARSGLCFVETSSSSSLSWVWTAMFWCSGAPDESRAVTVTCSEVAEDSEPEEEESGFLVDPPLSVAFFWLDEEAPSSCLTFVLLPDVFRTGDLTDVAGFLAFLVTLLLGRLLLLADLSEDEESLEEEEVDVVESTRSGRLVLGFLVRAALVLLNLVRAFFGLDLALAVLIPAGPLAFFLSEGNIQRGFLSSTIVVFRLDPAFLSVSEEDVSDEEVSTDEREDLWLAVFFAGRFFHNTSLSRFCNST
jgi:hypothetical protein